MRKRRHDPFRDDWDTVIRPAEHAVEELLGQRGLNVEQVRWVALLLLEEAYQRMADQAGVEEILGDIDQDAEHLKGTVRAGPRLDERGEEM